MKSFFFILLCIGISYYGQAQAMTYGEDLPKELIKDAYDIIRLYEKTITIKSPREREEEVTKVVTILNRKSGEDIQIIDYDQDSKITHLEAEIYDNSGKLVRKFKKKEAFDESYYSGSLATDTRYKRFNLRHNQLPYTIKYRYKKVYKNCLGLIPFYVQSYDQSVASAKYTVKTDDEVDIIWRARNFEQEPTISNEKNRKVYRWEWKNLPAIVVEPYGPNFKQIFPVLELAPTKIQYDDYKGSLTTWEAFGKFMYTLNQDRTEISEVLRAEIKKMTAAAETPAEKIAILYRYLQENTRYVSVQLGIGGWQSFPATYVEKNKYGDCKALSNFMCAMLKEVGIESYLTIIQLDRDYKRTWDSTLVAPYNSNHMILYVPEEDIWLECTSSYSPPNYLGQSTEGRTALLITPEGGRLIETPKLMPEDNLRRSEATIVLSPKGAAEIKSTVQQFGAEQEAMRYYQYEFSQKEKEEWFLKNIDLPACFIKTLDIQSQPDEPVANTRYSLEVPRFASQAGKRIFVPLNKLNPFKHVPRLLEARQHPVQVRHGFHESDTFTFRLPAGFTVESIPEKTMNLSSEFGQYQMKIDVKDGELIYIRQLEIYPVTLPADRYNDLRNFYKEISKADDMKVVLVR